MATKRKVVLVGPPGAGKTSFFNRCVREGQEYIFNPHHIPTTLVDTKKRLTRRVRDTEVEFYLVDTVGEALIWGSVFVGVRMILFLFDLNNQKSWTALTASDGIDNIEYAITRRKGKMHEIDCLVIGTHSDLPCNVEREEIDEFVDRRATVSDDYEVPLNYFRLDRTFFECSSKSGDGIREIMDYVAKTLARDERVKEEEVDKNVIKVDKTTVETSGTKGNCCL